MKLDGFFRGLFPPLSQQTRVILDRLPGLIDKTFPLPARFRSALPRNVAELSRLLTSGRAERGASYLGRPALLSAYLRYYLPWNIYRLCRLFSTLPLELKPGDAINDLGAGPLTLAASLWISRPELRNIPLEFRCVDRTTVVLEAGKKFFAALTLEAGCPWIIKTIRAELRINGTLSTEIRGKPAALSAALNVYNELFWNFSPMDTEGLRRFARSQARQLSSLTENPGFILLVEPGIPRSGEFVSLLRTSLIEEGRFPISPCTHHGACPMPGGKTRAAIKARWCHFAFDTEDAPKELHKLSADSNIPKDRAVLSFILAGNKTQEKQGQSKVKMRVISDCFRIEGNLPADRTPGKASWGRYGCSGRGLVLVKGNKRSLEALPSGALEEVSLDKNVKDKKSGALIGVCQ